MVDSRGCPNDFVTTRDRYIVYISGEAQIVDIYSERVTAVKASLRICQYLDVRGCPNALVTATCEHRLTPESLEKYTPMHGKFVVIYTTALMVSRTSVYNVIKDRVVLRIPTVTLLHQLLGPERMFAGMNCQVQT